MKRLVPKCNQLRWKIIEYLYQNGANMFAKSTLNRTKMDQDGTEIDQKCDQEVAENKLKTWSQHKTEYTPEPCFILPETAAKLGPSRVPKRNQNRKKNCQKINAFFDACLKPSWDGFWWILGSKMEPSWDQSCKKIEDGWKSSENQKILQKPMPKQ